MIFHYFRVSILIRGNLNFSISLIFVVRILLADSISFINATFTKYSDEFRAKLCNTTNVLKNWIDLRGACLKKIYTIKAINSKNYRH